MVSLLCQHFSPKCPVSLRDAMMKLPVRLDPMGRDVVQ